MDSETYSLLILSHVRGLGRISIKKLIKQFGSAAAAVAWGLDREKRLFGSKTVACWEEDMQKAESPGVEIISCHHPLYPASLLDIKDYPLLLYVKGRLLPQEPGCAVIGTRNATLYGTQRAQQIAGTLAHAGWSVISGLARGIDTAAHRGALDAQGRTIAVMGSGFSNIYPRENRELVASITQQGAVISEYAMHVEPARGLFPQRNRIISGMAKGVCLIESPLKGGAMLTMDIAAGQAKPLFATVGRVDWPTFAGNHRLIMEKKASLIEKGEDILKHFEGYEGYVSSQALLRHSSCRPAPILCAKEQALLQQMPDEEKSIESLVLLTQLSIIELNVLLTTLVLKRQVREFPGKIYKKIVDTWEKH